MLSPGDGKGGPRGRKGSGRGKVVGPEEKQKSQQ